jgi:nickel/cobalt exporter
MIRHLSHISYPCVEEKGFSRTQLPAEREEDIWRLRARCWEGTGGEVIEPAYLAVVMIGLLHGLEPGHGWPVAFLYSTRKDKPFFYGLVSSSLISLFHFMSSIAVVLTYVLLSSFVVVSTSVMKFAAAALLVILAYRFITEEVKDELEAQHGHLHEFTGETEHEHLHHHPGQAQHTHWHKHAKSLALSLWSIATFAFVLGFAHEEEFALLALAVSGVNPLSLMILYAASVTLSLVGVTLLSVKAYQRVQPRIKRYEKYMPKVSGIVLLLMAVVLVLG